MTVLLITIILFLLAVQNVFLARMIYRLYRKIDDFETRTIRVHFKDREIQAERYNILTGQIEHYSRKNHKIIRSFVTAFRKVKR